MSWRTSSLDYGTDLSYMTPMSQSTVDVKIMMRLADDLECHDIATA